MHTAAIWTLFYTDVPNLLHVSICVRDMPRKLKSNLVATDSLFLLPVGTLVIVILCMIVCTTCSVHDMLLSVLCRPTSSLVLIAYAI